MNGSVQGILKTIVRIHSYGQQVDFARPFRNMPRVSGVGTGTFLNPKSLGIALPRDVQDSFLFVLTCAHVVDGSDQVTVVLPLVGSEQIDATVLAFVPRTQ